MPVLAVDGGIYGWYVFISYARPQQSVTADYKQVVTVLP
jgi:hypothetical protein